MAKKSIRLENIPERLMELIINKKLEYMKQSKGRHISDEKTIYKMLNECEECIKIN